MIKRLKFIFGTIIGVMVGLIIGWLLSGLLTASLFLFLLSDLPEPWANVQEKIAIIVVIIGWVLIILGGFIGGRLGWRRSRGEPTRLLNELKLKNLLPVFIVLVGGGTVLIVGWWVWGNLPLPKKLNKAIEGVFYPVPTDPTALVVGFRTCDGSEYYVHTHFDTADFGYLKDGSLVKGTFRLVNPTIGGGLVKLHGYAPFTTKKVDNLIKDVDQVIFISDSECIPSTGFLRRQIIITTDKVEYEQGETVKITIRNSLDKPVWYLGDLCDPRCCGVERLKDDNWEPVEKILCILPERGFVISPQKLEAGKEFSQEWEQMKRVEYDTHTFVEPGEYRASFPYGLSESSYEENITYSSKFTIKEKEYPTYGKIIDVNLMVHRDDTVTEAEPIEVKMGRPTSPSILKQLEGGYLLRVGERVDRLWIGTVLWSQPFPIDFDYTGPVIEGIDYSEIRYDRVFVSFRIPYEPRMKSLQLWHKDKLIFFKELPKFYPINGVITDYKGKPVERVFVQLGGVMSGSTFTDPDGNYSFSELKEGSYSIIVSPSGKLNLMSESKEVELSSEETITINFTLQPCGSIAGKITDVQGNPLIEAWAQIVGFETPQYHVQKDGSYIIPYLQMGEYEVKVDVKIGEKYIEIPPKKAKVELGQTTTVNFVLEK